MRNRLHQIGLLVIGVLVGVAVSLNFSAVAQKGTATAPLPIEELRAFTEVFGRVKSDYVEQVDDKKLITEAINGMLTGLDPHSAYLDQEAFKELQVGTQGEFGGLGIEVGMEDGFVKVVAPIDDTPAARAGLKSGDLIVKLDDTSVKGMTLQEAVKRMRGRPNTNITLTIVRKGEAKPVVVTLTRAVIKIQSVKSKMLEPGYVYFRVTQFQEQTGETLARAIEKHFKENQAPMKGLVLDLRNNPGGLLSQAVKIADLFLDTFPYGAHSTAADALTMGLPVLTAPGNGFASRFCSSIVAAAGVPELICDGPDDFVRKAIGFARDRQGLSTVRQALERQRDASVLRDIPALVRRLEELFWQMQGECERGEAPVPDLSNLDLYYEVGAEIMKENVEFMDPAAYRQRYVEKLAQWHAFSPIPFDSRLWTAATANAR